MSGFGTGNPSFMAAVGESVKHGWLSDAGVHKGVVAGSVLLRRELDEFVRAWETGDLEHAQAWTAALYAHAAVFAEMVMGVVGGKGVALADIPTANDDVESVYESWGPMFPELILDQIEMPDVNGGC